MNAYFGKPRVIALKIDFEREGRARSIYPALLCDADERVLVDCGYPGFLPLLERASEKAGVPFEHVTGIVITHHDYDHYGALSEIAEKYPHVRVMSSEFDAPYIEGKIMSMRISRGLEVFDSLTDEMKMEAMKFRHALEAVKPSKIDATLRDGTVMPWCGGTEILSTPGHMPGHISLYVRPLGTLIAGDALVASRRRAAPSIARYATDPEEAKNTSRRLLEMNASEIICYHGGVVRADK
jgi:glyoxylase-like metal-dependent hydrolase (beta-lactamase superfamily II)